MSGMEKYERSGNEIGEEAKQRSSLMRRYLRVLSVVGCVLVVGCLASAARADLVDDFWKAVKDNGGLEDGDWIRVVFVTSTSIDALSPDRSYYDDFGDARVQTGLITKSMLPENSGDNWKSNWEPLVTTSNDSGSPVTSWLDANPDGLDPLPKVFNTAGELVATSATDMDSSALLKAVRYDESGDDQTLVRYDSGEPVQSSRAVWTGTLGDGSPATFDFVRFSDLTLGGDSGYSVTGDANVTGTEWLGDNTVKQETGGTGSEGTGPFPPGFDDNGQLSGVPIELPIYVMSGAIKVVPEPSAVLLWVAFSGLASLIYWRKRRS